MRKLIALAAVPWVGSLGCLAIRQKLSTVVSAAVLDDLGRARIADFCRQRVQRMNRGR
jgi:hypothetical protein